IFAPEFLGASFSSSPTFNIQTLTLNSLGRRDSIKYHLEACRRTILSTCTRCCFRTRLDVHSLCHHFPRATCVSIFPWNRRRWDDAGSFLLLVMPLPPPRTPLPNGNFHPRRHSRRRFRWSPRCWPRSD